MESVKTNFPTFFAASSLLSDEESDSSEDPDEDEDLSLDPESESEPSVSESDVESSSSWCSAVLRSADSQFSAMVVSGASRKVVAAPETCK